VFEGTPRFQILRRLGAGGMGAVFEVHDRERDMVVALKLLSTSQADGVMRFKREFRALQAVHHPNLVSLGELFSHGDSWFFTMELIRGRRALDACSRRVARLARAARRLRRGAAARELPPARSRRGGAAPKRTHSSRHQADQRDGDGGESRRAARLRAGARRVGRARHTARPHRRHARIHVARTGDGQGADARVRLVRGRRAALRGAHRRAPVHRRTGRDHGGEAAQPCAAAELAQSARHARSRRAVHGAVASRSGAAPAGGGGAGPPLRRAAPRRFART